MKKEHVLFLIVGFAFGILFGYGIFNAVALEPDLSPGAAMASQGGAMGPQGPLAPTQVGPGGNAGAAPMMAEINGLKKRLQDNPDDLAALGRMANIYHDVAMWDQAVQYYERALELNPSDPDLMTDLGICLRGLQRYEQALELFDRAHGLDSNHWQSLFNTVIVAAFDTGEFARARAALASMEAMNPQPPRLADLRQALERAEASSPSSEGES